MQSRMDKYQTRNDKKFERTNKNTKLYEDVYDDIYRDTTYKNMQVIDSAKEININKLKDMIDDKYDTRQYRTLKNYSIEDIDVDKKPIIYNRRQKSYDINEIINEAKSNRAFIEETKEKQKYMDFAKRNNNVNDKYEAMEKEEKELEELINTMAIPKSGESKDALDMFSDLKGDDNTVVTNPIETSFDDDKEYTDNNQDTEDINESKKEKLQKTLVKADRTFYTDSNMFTKNDFEDFSTLTRELKKSGKGKKIFLILLILIILAISAYLVITKYIIK